MKMARESESSEKRAVKPWQKLNNAKVRKYVVPASVATLLLLIVVAIANATAINHQLHAWKLLPEPERLTELYYENHTKLPTTFTVETPLQFSFTAHNLEYQTATYYYTISQSSEDGKKSQTLSSGSFTLPQDAYHTQPIVVAPVYQSQFSARSQITTTIKADITGGPAVNESIHFWVSKK